jgi:hypothetical protein
MKKALAVVGHGPIPFSVSRPRRRHPSTPLDLVRVKAVDRSLQRSFTDPTRTTAIVSCRLAMLETYEHPTISWRRVDHLPLHETGSFLPSRMLPKVSVLCPFCSPIPSRDISLSKPVWFGSALRRHEYSPITYLPPTLSCIQICSKALDLPSDSPLRRG